MPICSSAPAPAGQNSSRRGAARTASASTNAAIALTRNSGPIQAMESYPVVPEVEMDGSCRHQQERAHDPQPDDDGSMRGGVHGGPSSQAIGQYPVEAGAAVTSAPLGVTAHQIPLTP